MKNQRHNVMSVPDESLRLQKPKESEPHVGLFYVVAGKLHWEGIPTEQAGTSEYVKIYAKKHAAYWEELVVRLEPYFRKYDPYHFPRGRVVFSTQEGIYRLLADNCILENPELIKRIVSEMKLPEAEVKISWDIDCECAECKSKSRREDGNFVDGAVGAAFTITEDGRKLFFPFGGLSHGYVVPSAKECERLRREQAFWVKLAAPVGTFPMLLAAFHVERVTGSSWLGIFTFCVSGILVVVSNILWVRMRCRGLKRTYWNS